MYSKSAVVVCTRCVYCRCHIINRELHDLFVQFWINSPRFRFKVFQIALTSFGLFRKTLKRKLGLLIPNCPPSHAITITNNPNFTNRVKVLSSIYSKTWKRKVCCGKSGNPLFKQCDWFVRSDNTEQVEMVSTFSVLSVQTNQSHFIKVCLHVVPQQIFHFWFNCKLSLKE